MSYRTDESMSYCNACIYKWVALSWKSLLVGLRVFRKNCFVPAFVSCIFLCCCSHLGGDNTEWTIVAYVIHKINPCSLATLDFLLHSSIPIAFGWSTSSCIILEYCNYIVIQSLLFTAWCVLYHKD